jgi:hypothetical protein
MKLLGLVPNSYIHVYICERLYISRISQPIWPQQNRQGEIHECGDGTLYFFLEIMRQDSFIFGNTLHKSEPYIYIGFSPALHLQCIYALHNVSPGLKNSTKEHTFMSLLENLLHTTIEVACFPFLFDFFLPMWQVEVLCILARGQSKVSDSKRLKDLLVHFHNELFSHVHFGYK